MLVPKVGKQLAQNLKNAPKASILHTFGVQVLSLSKGRDFGVPLSKLGWGG